MMKLNRNLLAISVGSLISLSALGQDKHFSQYWASPIQLNPAFTGKFDGTLRVAGNYRNQWPDINKAFITQSASVDFKIMKDKINFNDTWGVGLAAFSDQSASGVLVANNLAVSTAYHKGLDEDGNHQLGVGFQLAYMEKSLNTSSTKLQFGDALTPNGWTNVTSDVLANRSLRVSHLDLNAGVLYSGSTNENNNFYLGASVYHITRPKESFVGANYLANPRFTTYGGGYFNISDRAVLYGSALHSQQAKTSETLLGSAIGYTPNPDAVKPSTVFGGAWVRLNDAVIPYLGLEVGDYKFGFSYDINTSRLRTASQGRGGVELSLIYIRRPNTDKGIPCPKF
jgi:type IX secretion system PorP/SprF family membrane protein